MIVDVQFVSGFATAVVVFGLSSAIYSGIKLAILERRVNHGLLKRVNLMYELATAEEHGAATDSS